ncbi:MAG: rhodanese-like domain-containing protein [Planctomycetota bacterium]
MNPQQSFYEAKLAYEIDSWDLSEAIKAGENVTVVDARSPQAFARKRIPGAVSLPHRSMTKESTDRIDASSLVVTYCDGIGCNASTKGALAMSRLGFRVRELMGGLDWWIRDGHPVEGDGEPSDCGCGDG